MEAGTGKYLCNVNVTPFVDVMLVLLIIFMVTTPIMKQSMDVDLPKSKTVYTLPKNDKSLVLTVKADKVLYLDQYEVLWPDLENQIRQLVTSQDKQLYLKTDQTVSYGTIMQLLGILKDAGVHNLGIVADRDQ